MLCRLRDRIKVVLTSDSTMCYLLQRPNPKDNADENVAASDQWPVVGSAHVLHTI